MKNKFPFFYEVYGKQFIEATDIDESELVPWIPASLGQYFIKYPEKFTEGSHHIDDTYIINTKMGLILYSQFLRQADTRISGYFNILEHTDPEEFKHKVFKGGTVFDVNYVAHEDKVMSTVRTRLCAFAMSSGDDPCSWSYFLNNFLPDNITPEEFMSMLPCKFAGKKLVDCKNFEDIKFRNEGKELSNCPCPLGTLSMKDAESKRSRDNNKIGNAFYELTKYLINE